MNVYGHETWGKMMGRNPRNPRHHQSLHGFNSTSESISYQLAVSISCTSFQVMGDGHIELTRELRGPVAPRATKMLWPTCLAVFRDFT